MRNKHILDMSSLTPGDIKQILDTAVRMKEISRRPIKKVPTLRGKTVVHFFYEPSTRTSSSFMAAMIGTIFQPVTTFVVFPRYAGPIIRTDGGIHRLTA